MGLTLEQLKEKGLAPEFLNEHGLQTLEGGYLNNDESPYDMYKRIANAAVS